MPNQYEHPKTLSRGEYRTYQSHMVFRDERNDGWHISKIIINKDGSILLRAIDYDLTFAQIEQYIRDND